MKGKLKWIVIVIIAVVVIASIAGGSDSNEPKKTGEVTADTSTKDKKNSDASDTGDSKKSKEETFKVGDIVETSDLKISFLSAKTYHTDNEFLKPKKGHVYYRMVFEFENIGDSDETVSSFWSMNCYADGYSMDQAYIGDDNLSATLSPGKKAKGAVYYEVPKKAKKITLELEPGMFSSDKIVFIAK